MSEPSSGAREADPQPVATFEDAQRELEAIVERLERGNATLDEAIALWERGQELYRFCVTKLDAAQGAVEELGRRGAAARP